LLQITNRFSSKIIKKGDIFTIYFDVINGYEQTVKIKEITISQPLGFIPLTYEHQQRKQMPFWDKIFKKDKRNGSTATQSWNVGAFRNTSFTVAESSVTYEQPNEKIRGASLIRQLDEPLEPKSTYSEIFYFKAGSSLGLRPRPDTYAMYCDVKYRIGEKTYHHRLVIDISIFPSFGSMLVGTFVGGILGTFLKEILSKENIWNDILTNGINTIGGVTPVLFSNLIIGFIVLVLLMRKQDVQPFVTIEDFWGGILIGFLSSFTSSQILDYFSSLQIINTGSDTNMPTNSTPTSQ
jgi:hypothetical protein